MQQKKLAWLKQGNKNGKNWFKKTLWKQLILDLRNLGCTPTIFKQKYVITWCLIRLKWQNCRAFGKNISTGFCKNKNHFIQYHHSLDINWIFKQSSLEMSYLWAVANDFSPTGTVLSLHIKILFIFQSPASWSPGQRHSLYSSELLHDL